VFLDRYFQGLHSFAELFEGNHIVATGVESSDYRNQLFFTWTVTNFLQKAPQCPLVDEAQGFLINSFEATSYLKTRAKYKADFLLLNTQVKIDFCANQVRKIALYAARKRILWSGSFVWSLGN